MNKKIRLIFIVVFFLVSCHQNTKKIEKKHFSKAIEQISVDTQYKWIVVLPGMGCNGCILEAEFFMKNHIEDRRILFVLTRLSSLKIFQQKTGISIDEHPNIFVDRNNLFSIPTNNSFYPCVILLNNGKHSSHSFQDPSNAAFRNLEENL